MKESVFREFIQEGVRPNVFVQESLPRKGKPAKKTPGSKTVYIVKIRFGERESPLESARGGPREWASLDKLANWLKMFGIVDYTIRHTNTEELLQRSLAFSNGDNS